MAALAGLALALAGCGGDRPPEGCAAAHLDPQGTCTRGSVIGVLQLQVADEATTAVTLGMGSPDGGETIKSIQRAGGGPFSFEGVAPGTWRLALSADGYTGRSLDVQVAAGRATDVGTIALEPDPSRPASLEGSIRLAGAAEHGGTLVWLDDSTLRVATSPDGTFRLGDLEPGAHVLHARHDGHAPLDEAIVLVRGPNAVDLTMERLAGEGTLSGTIADSESGAPIEGATVVVGDAWAGTSDADGEYAIEGVPSGIHQVTAGRSGYLTAVANGVSIAAGAVTRRDFALVAGVEPSRLYGVARRMHAAEEENGGIEVRLAGTPFATETDALGRWRLDEADDGRYDVVFSDPRFPPVTVRNVTVSDGRFTRVDDVELGPAKRIFDGHSISSRFFPKRRKVVAATSQGTFLFLFDAATWRRSKVSDDTLEVIAVDAEERHATLAGRGKLFRLDLSLGTLVAIEAPAIVGLVSDRALTLFVGGDLVLYALRAGETIPEVVAEGAGPGLEIRRTLDDARGRRVVWTFGTEVFADFEAGWIGPAGAEVVAGTTRSAVVTVGPSSALPGRTIFWSDVEARESKQVAERASFYGSWGIQAGQAEDGFVFYTAEGRLGVVDVATGEVTTLVGSSEELLHASDRWILTLGGGGREIRWASNDPPSSGFLCEDAQAVAVTGSLEPVVFCLEGEGPHVLRAFTERFGARTWSEDAMGLPAEADGDVYAWSDAEGLLHVRSPLFAADLSIPCALPDATLTLGGSGLFVQATCATQPGTFLLDHGAGEVRHLSEPAGRCSVAPDGAMAACTHPCGDQTCVRLHAFDPDTSIDVSSSPQPSLHAIWGKEGGGAIRTGAGAFHATLDEGAPRVTSCGLPDASPSRVAERFSLWFDLAGRGIVCGIDGTTSAPFVPWSSGITRVGQSQRYFLGGYLVDLSDGSVEHLVETYGYEVAYPGGLLITTSVGLVRVPMEGAPTWLFEDEVVGLAYGVPFTGFLVEGSSSFDLVATDGAGGVHTVVEGGVEVVPSGGRALVFHGEGPDGASLAIVDAAAHAAFVPERVADGRWRIEGSRIFFDTPAGAGYAFATAYLESGASSILHPAPGTPVGAGDDDWWIFNAEGWTWQEEADGARAVIAGEAARVQSASGGAIVFHAVSPDATYLLERPDP
ncbi:MAG TPA: carboxypeptidase regulatory-like domain-containing protein [Vulgatibacter sp.]|nr:carboxypeptidase regulatory-like domain-containing protein [Vulgatibacter sp.]